MREAEASFKTARMIAIALATGVVMFWLVAWLLTDGGRTPISPDAFDASLGFWVWAAALAGLFGALSFRRKALQSVDAVQPNLIIAWALLEGPALLAGVAFLLSGARTILFTG